MLPRVNCWPRLDVETATKDSCQTHGTNNGRRGEGRGGGGGGERGNRSRLLTGPLSIMQVLTPRLYYGVLERGGGFNLSWSKV